MKYTLEYPDPIADDVVDNDINTTELDEVDIKDIDSNGKMEDGTDWMPNLPAEYRLKLILEFQNWKKTKQKYEVTSEQLKTQLMDDLSFLSKMSVTEYTLYKKWAELHKKYNISKSESQLKKLKKFFGEFDVVNTNFPDLLKVKKNIWVPEDVNDYQKLQPVVEYCDSPEKLKIWNILRTFTHTQINNSNIGRNLYFTVSDTVTGMYLGVIAVSSDFLDLTPRDEYIGWNREVKTQQKMINHTAIGSTICPTQPLGFNYVGGKLLALLTLSDVIENKWNETYDTIEMPSKLVGMTTTSLYSSFSQYQNLKYWSKKGHSAGSIKFEPHETTLKMVRQYLETKYPVKYWEWYIATEPGGMPLKRDYKQRSLAFLYSKLSIDKELTQSNHTRGIYFCNYYENMKEYLKKEISEDKLIRRKDFDNSVGALTQLWKDKYASKRVKSLQENNRLDLSEFLFYDEVIISNWNDTLKKYSKDVGR
jgi:hypothetical protein